MARRDVRDFLHFAEARLALSNSQLLQDLWVVWQIGFPSEGYFLDVGAGDGVYLSNSLLLERFGWNGLLVEPNPRFTASIETHRQSRHARYCIYPELNSAVRFLDVPGLAELSRVIDYVPEDSHERAGRREDAAEIVVPGITAAQLMRQYECPPVIDYLSLDIEGAELVFLESVDWTAHRFRTITVEHNFTAQRAEIANFLSARDYVRVFGELTAWDDWYVAKEVLDDPGATVSAQRARVAAADPFDRLDRLYRDRGDVRGRDRVARLRRIAGVAPVSGQNWLKRRLSLGKRLLARWTARADDAVLRCGP